MWKRKFFKKAALAAAICLSLTQSVWAMPTGGAIESGTVTGFDVNPASGATFATSGGPAIINWDAFGLLGTDTMTFNTTNGALLNRVTGANISEIFGTLTQTGGNPMFLVNPNGILVGSGATINANNLVLSTLAISNDDFLNNVTNGNCSFAGPASGKAAALQFKEGATVNITGSNGMLKALGGSIEVADGVIFTGTTSADINLIAAQTANGKIKNGATMGMTGTADNTLTISKSTLNSGGQIYLQGGNFSITDSTIEAKELYLRSAENFIPHTKQKSVNTTVTVKNSQIKATKDDNGVDETIGRSFIVGGNVSIENSNLHGIENLRAFEGWDYGGTSYPTYTTNSAHTVAIANSTLDSARRLRLQGGRISVAENSGLNAPLVQLWAENRFVNTEDISVSDNDVLAQNLEFPTLDNTVAVTNSTMTAGNGISFLGNTSVSNSTFSSSGDIDLLGPSISFSTVNSIAATNFYAEAYSYENGIKNYSTGNGVTMEHVKVSAGNDFKITGKTIDLTTVELSGMNDAKIIAADKGKWNEGTGELTFSMTPDNTMTANTLRIADTKAVTIAGGKVDLTTADLSTIRNTSDKRDTEILATPGLVINYYDQYRETNPTFDFVTGNPSDYSVSLKGTKIKLETEGNLGDPSIDIGGGKITLDQSSVELTGGDDNGIHLFAFSSATGTDDNQIITTDPTNLITLKNGSSIISKGERLAIAGGKIVIQDNSSVEKISAKPSKPGLFVVSSNEIGWDNANNTYSTAYPVAKGSQGTVVVTKDSRILLNGDDVTDQFATTRSILSDEVDLPTDATTLVNVESGFEAMDAILAKANAGNVQDLTRELVTSINKDASTDNRTKAAQISGVILAIWQNEGLTADSKKALEREVIQTFYPTQVAITTSDNQKDK